MTNDWIILNELAHVARGYKSLQNNFFYLNRATIQRYGIESEFLIPIFQLKELNNAHYLQSRRPSTFLFYCKNEDHDLKGTGALRYIYAMAGHAATEKKQSGKVATIKQVLEDQGGKIWYAPKASPHKAHIWLRKAFDSIYSPYLFQTSQAVDQRCNLISPKKGIPWEALASVMSSSLFSMSIEVNGAASMGGVRWKPLLKNCEGLGF